MVVDGLGEARRRLGDAGGSGAGAAQGGGAATRSARAATATAAHVGSIVGAAAPWQTTSGTAAGRGAGPPAAHVVSLVLNGGCQRYKRGNTIVIANR